MATKEWNKIDQYKIEDQEFYCVFLDILGYKEKSESYFDGKYNLHGRFKRALSDALAVISIGSIMIDLTQLDIKFFSDSIIISLPKTSKGQDNLFGVLFFCKVLSAHLSYEELYVRGGLSFGGHKDEIDKEFGFSFLSSIALQRAYILESKAAKYPRILIDANVIPFLTNDEKTLVAKDDCEFFVHFSSQLINVNGNNAHDVLLEMEDIYIIRSKLKNQTVIEKYDWLLDYYYWTLSLCPNVNMSNFSKFNSGHFNKFSLL